MIRDSVRAAFVPFNTHYESCLSYMYLDVKCLVTTGIGDLIDPLSDAVTLPWLRKDGSVADYAEVVAEWNHIKSATALARLGGGAFARLATLHLSASGIEALVFSRELLDDKYLEKRWPAFASWPADAQLGALSCAWGAGPGWKAPRLDAAMAKPDFDIAAGKPGDANEDPDCRGEAWLDDRGNPGLRPRNIANKLLFENAACVESMSEIYDPDTLYYPTRLTIA
jgi:hypothetical protein